MASATAHPNAHLIEAFLKALFAARGAVEMERDARAKAESALKRVHAMRNKPILAPKIDPAGLFGAERWHALDAEARSVISTRLMEEAPGFQTFKNFTQAFEAASSAQVSTSKRLDDSSATARAATATYADARATLLTALRESMALPANLLESAPLTVLELLTFAPDPLQTLVDPPTISTMVDASGHLRGEPKVVVRISGRGPGLNRCPHCGAPAQEKCGCRKKSRHH